MTNKNKQREIVKVFTTMSLAYPNFEPEDGTPQLYARLLQDLLIEHITAAANQLMAESTFFPSVAEWRKKAIDIQINRAGLPSEYEAWEIVQKEIVRIGSYGKPEFENPLVTRAVEIMGWRSLCLSEQPEYDRAHFFKVYASLVNRAIEDVRTLPEVKAVMGLSAAKEIKKLSEKLSE